MKIDYRGYIRIIVKHRVPFIGEVGISVCN